MEILFGTLFFILGSIIGSFLNVVSMRYGTGTMSKNRSFCMSCNKILKWHEIFPVFSFLFLKGRCSSCKSKISLENPLIEIITGTLFLLVFLKFGITLYGLFLLIIFSILIVISIYDFHHKIIPDGLVFLFIGVSFMSIFLPALHAQAWQASIDLGNIAFTLDNLGNLLGAILVPLPFFLIWLVSKGEWMGFGDVKLMVGIGLFLGMLSGFSSVVIGFWIGAVVSISLILYQKISSYVGGLKPVGKSLTMKSEIPLGPFLILGFILEILFEFNLFYF